MTTTPRQRQTLLWTAVAALLILALLALGPVLTPFVAALVLGYVLAPAVQWLHARRVPRVLAVLIVIVVSVALIGATLLLLVPIVQREAGIIRLRLPDLIANVTTQLVPRIEAWLGVDVRLDAAGIRAWLSELLQSGSEEVAATVGFLFGYVRSGWGVVAQVLGLMFLVPVVLFYLLLDWPDLIDNARRLIPLRWRAQVLEVAAEIDRLLGQYLRGQLLVMGALAVFYSIGLGIAGFALWLPIGVLSGLLAFVPYLGFASALLLALISGMLQFGPLYGLIAVAIVYGLGQAIESMFLTPVLVGERIGLHPLAVIFALLAFGYVFGFVGVLLALPMAAAVAVGLRRLRSAYLASDFHSSLPS